MTIATTLYDTFKRYRTLQSDRISALPIVILMPHSACNCRCVMCDIWKDNKNLKQLSEQDVSGLIGSFRKFGTRQVVMSGGEALLNKNFFRFCEILRKLDIRITLLSTGLTISRHIHELSEWVNDIIVSIDGPPAVHDAIRNINGSFALMREGVLQLKSLKPGFRITSRTVIHRLNFRHCADTIESAREMGIDQVSFLPADVSSHAFNREVLWSDNRQHEILPDLEELKELEKILDGIVENFSSDFENGFIAESPVKLRKIYDYYGAFYGLNEFPYKKCNAPWVSTVIEADGTVRPCFFHSSIGNIRNNSLDEILNDKKAIEWRRSLDTDTNETCKKCVCYLNLSPRARLQ